MSAVVLLLLALFYASSGAIVDVGGAGLRAGEAAAAGAKPRLAAVVINLDYREDRWASMLAAWSSVPEVELYRFPAIKHGEQMLYVDGEVKAMPNGVTASHLQIIEEAFKEEAAPALDPAQVTAFVAKYGVKPFAALRAGGLPPLERVLVLEDDARPGLFWNTTMPRLLAYAAEHSNAWEAINLAPSYAGTPPAYRMPSLYFSALPGTEDVLTTQSFVSAAAVLYNKGMAGTVPGFRRMAAGRTKDDDFAAIDVMYMEAGDAVRKWVASPPLAYQAPSVHPDISSTPTNYLTIFGVAGMDLSTIQQLLRYGAFQLSSEWAWRVDAINDAYAALAAHVHTHSVPGHDGLDVAAYEASVATLATHLATVNSLKASLSEAMSSSLRVRCDYAHPLDQSVWNVVSGTCGNEFRCGLERVFPNGTVHTPFYAGNIALVPLDDSPQNHTLGQPVTTLEACPPAPSPGPLPAGYEPYPPHSLLNVFVFINDDHSWHSMALSSIVEGRFAEVGCPACHPASSHFTHMLAKELGWKGILLAPQGYDTELAAYTAARPEFLGVIASDLFDYVHPSLGRLLSATFESEIGHSELQALLATHGIRKFDFMVTITGDVRRTPLALVPNNTAVARGVALLHDKLGESLRPQPAAQGDAHAAGVHPTAQALASALVHTVDSVTICGDMAARAAIVGHDFLRHKIDMPFVQVVGGLTQCWPLIPSDRPRTVRALRGLELHKDTKAPEGVTLNHGSQTMKLLDILMQLNPRYIRMQEAAAFIGYEILRGTDPSYHLFRRDASIVDSPLSMLFGLSEEGADMNALSSLLGGFVDDTLDAELFPAPGPAPRYGGVGVDRGDGLDTAHAALNALIDKDVAAARAEFDALREAERREEAAAAANAFDEWEEIAAHLGG